MTPDREQIRREAEAALRVYWAPSKDAQAFARACLALLSELEQAERERDDCKAAYAVLERRMAHE